MDFDEAILPEDSWEQPCGEEGEEDREVEREYAVEAVLDMRTKRATQHGRLRREYLVQWTGYDEPTWEKEENLSCGALLFEFGRKRRAQNRMSQMHVAEEEDEEQPTVSAEAVGVQPSARGPTTSRQRSASRRRRGHGQVGSEVAPGREEGASRKRRRL